MKKQTLKHLVSGGRAAVVLLSVLSLVISSVSAASRMAYTADKESAKKAVAELNQIVPGPPPPDDAHDKMATEGKPDTQPVALLTAPIFIQPDNDKRSAKLHLTVENQTDLVRPAPLLVSEPVGSVSQIAPEVGRQFTLVGAKPSGTS